MDPTPPDDLGTRRLTNDDPRDDMTLDDVFEAFNAEGALERPGEPPEERPDPPSPATDAAIPPPQ